jgi:hypothetical protein
MTRGWSQRGLRTPSASGRPLFSVDEPKEGSGWSGGGQRYAASWSQMAQSWASRDRQLATDSWSCRPNDARSHRGDGGRERGAYERVRGTMRDSPTTQPAWSSSLRVRASPVGLPRSLDRRQGVPLRERFGMGIGCPMKPEHAGSDGPHPAPSEGTSRGRRGSPLLSPKESARRAAVRGRRPQ